MMDDVKMRNDIQLLATQIRQIAQAGVIAEIDFNKSLVKIRFDKDIVSDWLAWTETLAGENHTWTPPALGDQAIVLALGGNLKRGVILGYLNHRGSPQISNNGDLQKVKFKNGSFVEVNNASNAMNITCTGNLTIECTGTATITAADASITCTATAEITAAAVNISGDSGDASIAGVSLLHHTHNQNNGNHYGGAATTTPPNGA